MCRLQVDIYTLAVSAVSKKKLKQLNCNQSWAVKCNLTDLFLGKVVDCRVVLYAVVVEVVGARIPEVDKLAMRVSALKPVELYVRGIFLAGNDCFVGYSNGGGVVALDRRSGLGPSHFGKRLVEWDHFFGADVKACKL